MTEPISVSTLNQNLKISFEKQSFYEHYLGHHLVLIKTVYSWQLLALDCTWIAPPQAPTVEFISDVQWLSPGYISYICLWVTGGGGRSDVWGFEGSVLMAPLWHNTCRKLETNLSWPGQNFLLEPNVKLQGVMMINTQSSVGSTYSLAVCLAPTWMHCTRCPLFGILDQDFIRGPGKRR